MSDAVAAEGLSSVPVAVRWLAAILFVVALPLFLILGNILDVASDRAFYESEFQKYRIREVTGLDDAQLMAVADRFIRYLREPSATLDVEITVNGARRPLFNAKEISHMVDVQKLFHLAGQARLVAGAILLLIPLLGIGLGGGPAFLPRLGMLLVAGGVATVVLLGLAGLLSLVDFTEAWTQFHHVAFSNDDWMLDPRTDYLIMLYPEGFWFDAVMKIAMQSALEAVVLGGIGVGIMYFGARR
ncbi:MAG: TIGR01906 family membrane protein [Chloroflexi bacterium]|nr:TIGR01906 family membrane protein [Chloroflexota bacterium]